VTGDYDPLLAKIVARGDDRSAALDALGDALERTEILGVRTNVPFLLRYLSHSEVRAGRVTTPFVERELATLVPRGDVPDDAHALAAAAVIDARPRGARDPWTALGSWRAATGPAGTVVLREDGRQRAVTVEGEGPYVVLGSHVSPDDAEPHAWTIGGTPGSVARDGEAVWVGWKGATYELRTDPVDHDVAEVAPAEIDAPMPGIVLSVQASSGQQLRRGDLVATLEAMKMELRVEAPSDGRVTAVLVRAGDQVKRGQRLADFDPTVPSGPADPAAGAPRSSGTATAGRPASASR
jgi:acetyl-CoA/propionyl-CoA carboxylase biotin carboxyl carrier protein